jgi:uncharacterized protein YegP (UPF0339 family)
VKRAHFRPYKDRRGQWRFKFVGANGEVMFPSEDYTRKASVPRAIARLRLEVLRAPIVWPEGEEPRGRGRGGGR